MESERRGYVSDWSAAQRSAVFAGALGAALGSVVGAGRGGGPVNGLVTGAVVGLVGGGTFVVVREGLRHGVRVRSWSDDWVALNCVAAGVASSAMAAVRLGGPRRVAGSFVGGALLGLGGSLV